MTDWNLSDKIFNSPDNKFGFSNGKRLDVEDVREFIKRLKTEVDESHVVSRDIRNELLELIDKLAGDKLL